MEIKGIIRIIEIIIIMKMKNMKEIIKDIRMVKK
jgi:hypothetical protein